MRIYRWRLCIIYNRCPALFTVLDCTVCTDCTLNTIQCYVHRNWSLLPLTINTRFTTKHQCKLSIGGERRSGCSDISRVSFTCTFSPSYGSFLPYRLMVYWHYLMFRTRLILRCPPPYSETTREQKVRLSLFDIITLLLCGWGIVGWWWLEGGNSDW